jgi:hypothetical protein
VCREMDKNFIVESKSFAFSVLGGALTLRVEWLALTLEVLLGFPEGQDFVKSFREG